MKVLAIIPAYNEAASLPAVLRELALARPDLEVLVVDDGSSDDTPQLLERWGTPWLRLGVHLGVGNAVRAGLRYARELGFDTVVRLDADGQHPPEAVAMLVQQLGAHEADAVRGSRYLAGSGRYATPPLRRATQRVMSAVLGLLSGKQVSDPTSGLWAFGPRAVRLLAREHPSGYAEPELHLLLHRRGLKVAEVPVTMRPRIAGKTTLTPVRALVALARAVLAMVVVPLRPVSHGADPD